MNSKKIIVLLMIIIIVIVVLGFFGIGYIIGNKFEPDAITNVTTQKQVLELDISSGRVINAYHIIPAYSTNKISVNAYQSSFINKNKLDNGYLLSASYDYLKSKLNENNIEIISGEAIDGDILKGTSYKFSSDLMHEASLYLYGDELIDESFEIGVGKNVTYEDGYYTYSFTDGSLEYGAVIREMNKAYEDDNYLYIEDSFLFYTFNNGESHLYTESNMINEVELSDEVKNSTEEANIILDMILTNNKNDMKKYKHTFKKNTDGSVYWHSSEPIE